MRMKTRSPGLLRLAPKGAPGRPQLRDWEMASALERLRPLLLVEGDTRQYHRIIERGNFLPRGWMRDYCLERTRELISLLVEGQGLSRNRNGGLRRERRIKPCRNKNEELYGKRSIPHFFPDTVATSKSRNIVDDAAIFRQCAEILERWRAGGIGEYLNHPRANNAGVVRDGVLWMQPSEEPSQDSC
jgi:hypothetical protein